MKNLLFIIILTSSISALGRNLALVLGGPSVKAQKEIDSNNHEFARGTVLTTLGLKDQGYEVTTLFSAKGIHEVTENLLGQNAKPEKEVYKKDYEFFKKNIPNSKAATRENLLKSLEDLSNNVRSNDNVKIVINAHGYQKCDNAGRSITGGKSVSDFDPHCHHEIDLFDKDGNKIKFKTSEILPYLKKIDAKANLDLVVESCHSGILKQNLNNLKNTCTALLSTGNVPGLGCFESDTDDDPSFTSTLEYIKMSFYHKSLDKLSKLPYLKDSKCLKNTMEYANKNKVDFNTSIYDVYWQARSNDKNYMEPAISSTFNLDYFKGNQFSTQMLYNEGGLTTDKVSCAPILSSLLKLNSLIDNSYKVIFNKNLSLLAKKLSIYNKFIGEQVDIIKMISVKYKINGTTGFSSSNSPVLGELDIKLAKIQQQTEVIGKELLSLERKSLNIFYKNQANSKKNDPCKRKL